MLTLFWQKQIQLQGLRVKFMERRKSWGRTSAVSKLDQHC